MVIDNNENKRTKERHNLYFYLKVIDANSGELAGRIVDITVDGMMLVNDSALEIGSTHKVRIILSDGLLGFTMDNVEVSFTTQWSKSDINPTLFVNGVKFKDLDQKCITSIQRIIEKLSFEETH